MLKWYSRKKSWSEHSKFTRDSLVLLSRAHKVQGMTFYCNFYIRCASMTYDSNRTRIATFRESYTGLLIFFPSCSKLKGLPKHNLYIYDLCFQNNENHIISRLLWGVINFLPKIQARKFWVNFKHKSALTRISNRFDFYVDWRYRNYLFNKKNSDAPNPCYEFCST